MSKIEYELSRTDPRLQGLELEPFNRETIARVIVKGEDEFRKFYPTISDMAMKFRLVQGLLDDGWIDPKYLLDKYVPERFEHPEVDEPIAAPLKDVLHLAMVQAGQLPISSLDKESSERIMDLEFRARPDLRDLIADDWPPEVVAQLMAVDMAAVATDARKMEELRAWTTRGIIREYLGTISGRMTRRDISVSELMDHIPERVFRDPAGLKYSLIEHYVEQRLAKILTDVGIQQGLDQIENLIATCPEPGKQQYLRTIHNRFYDIATYPFVGDFRNTIDLGDNQVRAFPSFEQRAFCYDFLHHGTKLLTAETGLGKTAAAYLAMENSTATRVLVVVPASGRETWEIESGKIFYNPDNTYVVEGSSGIEKAIASGKKYIVVSQELLGFSKDNPQLLPAMEKLVRELKIDGCVIDEIDNLSSRNAVSTDAVCRLVEIIRGNYAAQTQRSPESAPVIGLTATPIKSSLADLNVTMGLLYPAEYATCRTDSTATRKTYSDTHLNHPDLAYYTLVGERKMFRWEQAAGVQEFGYEIAPVEVSPFERYLYQFVVDEVPTNQLNKIRLLEDILCNPLLVKAEVRTIIAKALPENPNADELLLKLCAIANAWRQNRLVGASTNVDDFLNVDRLVEIGHGDFVLQCFFDERFPNGLDTLVEEFTRDSTNPYLVNLREVWQPRGISSKYRILKKTIQESLRWKARPDGQEVRQKVFIISPARQQGRTGDVLQRQVVSENGEGKSLYSQAELDEVNDSILVTLIREWMKSAELEGKVLILDGSVPIGPTRDRVITEWTQNPDAAVIVVVLEAAYQSRDFVVKVTHDSQGRIIDGVKKYYLSPPWYFQQLKQMSGRSLRQGQILPVDIRILVANGLVDQGKADAVAYTRLLSRMALSGIALTPEEKEFFDSKRIGLKIPFESPYSKFLKGALAAVRGAGEDRISELMAEPCSLRKEATNGRLVAERFYDNGRDEYHITGHNAEMVAYLIKPYDRNQDCRILSLGAGTLLLQRKLKRGIENVDLNPEMMRAGWQSAAPYGGKLIEERMSRLSETDFPSGKYDVVDCSFALHWSKCSRKDKPEDSERVKILMQMNRVLRNDGVLLLTLPEGSLNEERLAVFVNTLEKHFGFKVDRDYTGKSFGRSKTGSYKRIGWCVAARKVSPINITELKVADLEFVNENGEWISTGEKKKTPPKLPPARNGDESLLKVTFEQYEIVNRDNGKTRITDESAPITTLENAIATLRPEVFPTRVLLSPDFLRGGPTGSRSDFLQYRNKLLRPARDTSGKSWEETESLCDAVFLQLQQEGYVFEDLEQIYKLILKRIALGRSKKQR